MISTPEFILLLVLSILITAGLVWLLVPEKAINDIKGDILDIFSE